MSTKPPASNVDTTMNAPVLQLNMKKGVLRFPLLPIDIVGFDNN
jgi:hypothetical protein